MPTLHWLTREQDLKTSGLAPYRLLNHMETYGDANTENMLIQGDNLDGLKALLPYYAGKVKCIYIDPPYNTGKAFEFYDDNLEHSIWLSVLYPRLELLRELLANEGTFFCQLNDDEIAYARIILDEIFGRDNFLNQVSIKMKQTSGASGGGEDKRLKKNIEYILIYAKDKKEGFVKFHDVYDEEDLFEYIEWMKDEGKSWKYTRIIESFGDRIFHKTIQDGSGENIDIFKHENVVISPITVVASREEITVKECYVKYFDKIFRDTNAQSSIRTRVIDEVAGLFDFCSIDYIPRSGKNKGKKTTLYYKGNQCDLLAWLSDIAVKKGNKVVKLEKTGTYWDGFPLNNLTKEGGVLFPQGKKPEALIQKVFELATNSGDLVLDSFLGSGTTAAVAHKMGRRYIGIEIGEHATTHCIPRLQKVIEGEQGGISASINWQGGGGFRFYRLGEPIFDDEGRIRKDIRFPQLAAHVWFSETKTPWQPPAVQLPFLGVHEGIAYYLLYNGILKDKSVNGGNVLTSKILASLAEHSGPKVIYGERCLFSPTRLKQLGITFKHTPYDIKGR